MPAYADRRRASIIAAPATLGNRLSAGPPAGELAAARVGKFRLVSRNRAAEEVRDVEQPVYPASADPAFNLTGGPAGATAATLAAIRQKARTHLVCSPAVLTTRR